MLRNQKHTYIIFPYYFSEQGDLQHYDENDFKNRFPNTYAHLLNYNKDLLKRNSDKSAEWYEYGRSQALRNINQEKLIISTVITNRVEIYNLDRDTVPYSGIYIIANNEEYPLNKAKEILEDKSFFEYITQVWLIRWSGEKSKKSKYILEYRAIEKALAKWQALFEQEPTAP